jgi:hypothetical protein
MTLLASPHLLTYDLLLLTVPLLLLMDVWIGRVPRPFYGSWLLGGLYLTPLASSVIASATGVQVSTLLMGAALVTLWLLA